MVHNPLLVVEDDAFTRLSLVAALRGAGVDVGHETSSASEARTITLSVAALQAIMGKGPTITFLSPIE